MMWSVPTPGLRPPLPAAAHFRPHHSPEAWASGLQRLCSHRMFFALAEVCLERLPPRITWPTLSTLRFLLYLPREESLSLISNCFLHPPPLLYVFIALTTIWLIIYFTYLFKDCISLPWQSLRFLFISLVPTTVPGIQEILIDLTNV